MYKDRNELVKSLTFKTSRSGGKGGQNVNKVSSKVELILHVASADFFTAEEKELLAERLANRIDTEGNLHVVSQEDRSQLINKEQSIIKLMSLLKTGLHIDKKRKPTHTPKSVILRRKSDKKSIAAKKENRKKPGMDAWLN
ncbi:aminoacyl-tRNA hydrolase [Pedobacter sp. PAMC26386]|nr:aminoacyl-tRNA hydrolase [Pedobacter sp. PAMC26386]